MPALLAPLLNDNNAIRADATSFEDNAHTSSRCLHHSLSLSLPLSHIFSIWKLCKIELRRIDHTPPSPLKHSLELFDSTSVRETGNKTKVRVREREGVKEK